MKRATTGYIFKIYDSRNGDDFTMDLGDGKTFSSLENGFLAIDIPRTRNLVGVNNTLNRFHDIDLLIKTALLKQGGFGYFAFAPLTKKVQQSKVIDLNSVDNLSGSILGYFDIDISIIDQTIEKHRSIISYEEWVIGSCRDRFEKPVKKTHWYNKVIHWNIDYLLLQAERVNFLFYYNGEMDMSIILTRIFDGLDEALSKLKNAFRGA